MKVLLSVVAALVAVAALSTSARTTSSSAAVLDNDKDPDTIVCKRVNRQGSFTKIRICARRADWLEERRRSLHTLNHYRQLESHRPLPPHEWAKGQ